MFLFNTPPSGPKVEYPGLQERPVRSLVKALSWRVTGSIDTLLLSWFFTGDIAVAAAIGLTEVGTKMLLYYGHERAWNRIQLGREPRGVANAVQTAVSPLADPVR